jgi:hypothetical protein
MNTQNVLRAINIAVRAAFIVVGVLLIAGVFQFRIGPPQFRILFGAVLVLYGALRIVTLWPKKEVDGKS